MISFGFRAKRGFRPRCSLLAATWRCHVSLRAPGVPRDLLRGTLAHDAKSSDLIRVSI